MSTVYTFTVMLGRNGPGVINHGVPADSASKLYSMSRLDGDGNYLISNRPGAASGFSSILAESNFVYQNDPADLSAVLLLAVFTKDVP